MATYETSHGRRCSSKIHRYLVTYEEDVPDGLVLTFGVDATRPSEATLKVIDFIDIHKLHQSKEHGYALIYCISKETAQYNIPYKSNPEI